MESKMTNGSLDDRADATIEAVQEDSGLTSPLLAYKELVDLAHSGLSRAAFPDFFAPRPAPMTLTFAR